MTSNPSAQLRWIVGQVTAKSQLTGSDYWYLTPSLTLLLTLPYPTTTLPYPTLPLTLTLLHPGPANLCRTDKGRCLRVGFCQSLLQPPTRWEDVGSEKTKYNPGG